MENKTQWDLTLIVKDDSESQIQHHLNEAEKLNNAFVKRYQNQSNYLEDPVKLAEALAEYEKLLVSLGGNGNVGYYFGLRSELNQTDPVIKAKLNQISEVSDRMVNARRFFAHGIALIPQDRQATFLKAKELRAYRHFLEQEFLFARYLLTQDEESLLTLISMPAFENWVRMTESFLAGEQRQVLDENGQKALLPLAAINGLISDKNKAVRDAAGQALHQVYTQYAPVAENELNSILQGKKIIDDLRGYTRADQSRHLADDIESPVVDAMTAAVEQNFSISQQFYQLKARLMGVESLEYHERSVEYGQLPNDFPYDNAVEITRSAFAKLDQEFVEIFERLSRNGQIDVYPQKGKASGAFCACPGINDPTYILLNHTNRLRDVTTLAHELGHAINDELMKPIQNELTFGTPLSTAEVASTFMEDFVLEELTAGASDEEKLAINMMRLNDEVATIFRQVAAYRFEQQMHQVFRQKGYLPKEEIGQIFQKNMAAYMGKAIQQSPGSENWWVGWSHFRRFFYVYSYASGLLISKSLQRSVRQKPAFIENVKTFLRAGQSKSPKDIFMELGIDIADATFWQQGIQEVADLLKVTEELAKKLGKL